MQIYEQKIKCCKICGNSSIQLKIPYVYDYGGMSFDRRPDLLEQCAGIYTETEVCPNCGYAALDLEIASNATNELVNSTRYKTCDGIEFKHPLAKVLYRRYLGDKKNNLPEPAFNTLLRCAWICDDSNDENGALECRLIAADCYELFDKLDQIKYLMIYLDVLRRSKQYDKVLDRAQNTPLSVREYNNMAPHLKYMTRCANAKDGVNHRYQQSLDYEEAAETLLLLLKKNKRALAKILAPLVD